jgi:hypothetical protein
LLFSISDSVSVKMRALAPPAGIPDKDVGHQLKRLVVLNRNGWSPSPVCARASINCAFAAWSVGVDCRIRDMRAPNPQSDRVTIGSARATRPTPMVPQAPVTFSTVSGLPSEARRRSAKMRHACQDDVGLQADQLPRERSYQIDVTAGPTNVHPHVAVIGPTQVRKRLSEGRERERERERDAARDRFRPRT